MCANLNNAIQYNDVTQDENNTKLMWLANAGQFTRYDTDACPTRL